MTTRKSPSICIIGCGGVGKAHALSAAKYLIDNHNGEGTIHLVDVANTALEPFLSNIWENSWGPIKDTIDISNTKIQTTLNHIVDHGMPYKADLFIIATPDHTHADYLNTIDRDSIVICEKPLVTYGDPIPKISDNVHYGIEWCYHPALLNVHRIKKIQFVHGWPPPAATKENKWQVYDLGSHLLGLVMSINGELGEVKNVKTYQQITEWDIGGVQCICGYDKYVNTDKIIINDSVELDWIPFNSGDLFYLQIQWALFGWNGDGFSPMFFTSEIKEQMNKLQQIRDLA